MTILLEPHVKDLGGFSVRRLLPAKALRTIGPFIFFDHMGPADFAPGNGIDVRPHPHIGLSTVTYLFEGALMHRDSLGSVQRIEPGDVNWMTAGRGIVHSERSDTLDRANGHRLHGIQTWVALPRAAEGTDPSFVHVPRARLPLIDAPGVQLRLIVGDALGNVTLLEMSETLAVPHPSEKLAVGLAFERESKREENLEKRALALAHARTCIHTHVCCRTHTRTLTHVDTQDA
jgi:redox-sensitive bicupin YhaK (pirin superfamily)